ncbi:MAG: DUF5615 family PIN-like protein [Bryobacterales bacterium]|nr:DUF5615 family PIN-like protein [Bryobacterales bacterium]
MRLLADENFPKPVVEALRTDGHDVLWARTDLAGTSGVALLDLAESEARIVLTVRAFDSTDAVAVRRLARIQNISQELRFHAVNVAFADSPFERGAPLFYCQLPHFIGH